MRTLFLRSCIVVAALAVIGLVLNPQLPPAVSAAVVSVLLVVIIASARRLRLGDHDRLVETEQALRSTRTKYEAALDLLPTPICIVTHPEGKLVELNRSFVERFGYTPAEALGRAPSELGLWDDLADRDHFRDTVLAEGLISNFAVRWKAREGTVRHCLLTGSTILLEGVEHVVLVLLDVDERLRNEEALRKNEEKYRLLVGQAVDGIFIVEQGRCVEANGRGAAMLGATSTEIIGMSLDSVVFEEELPRVLEMRDEIIRTGSATRELKFKRRDGSGFWGEISISQLADGRRIGIVRDVSDRKRAESERLTLEARLRESQKLEAVGTMASGIAHDFNNILMVIRGNVELVMHDLSRPAAAIASLEAIRTAGNRASRLVRQILAFAGPQTAELAPVKLATVVDEAVALLRSTLPAGIAIECTFDEDAPPVLADVTQIHQVVINLCTNAWHAIDAIGTVRVKVARSTARLERYPELSTGEWTVLSVSDTGSGMSPETAARVFEPFFSTKEPGQGTGLGLWVVHNIVKGRRGVIDVTTAPGAGTTVDVYLPATRPGVVAPQATQPLAAPVRPVQRLLYVDDEAAVVLVMKRLLERRGHKVTGFVSAELALKAIEENPTCFDILATDYNMPKISGIELIKRVRLLRSDARLVLTSGVITDELRAEAAKLGVHHLIYKAASADELCDAIDRIALE